jgi:hypothetical protein
MVPVHTKAAFNEIELDAKSRLLVREHRRDANTGEAGKENDDKSLPNRDL